MRRTRLPAERLPTRDYPPAECLLVVRDLDELHQALLGELEHALLHRLWTAAHLAALAAAATTATAAAAAAAARRCAEPNCRVKTCAVFFSNQRYFLARKTEVYYSFILYCRTQGTMVHVYVMKTEYRCSEINGQVRV